MDALIVAARAAALLAGGILVGSIFLYEDEEGRVQSTFENWWLRASDVGKGAIRAHRNLVATILGALRRVSRSVIVGGSDTGHPFAKTLLFSFVLTAEFLLMFLPAEVYPAGRLYRIGVGVFIAVAALWLFGEFRNGLAALFLSTLTGAVVLYGLLTGTMSVTLLFVAVVASATAVNALYITYGLIIMARVDPRVHWSALRVLAWAFSGLFLWFGYMFVGTCASLMFLSDADITTRVLFVSGSSTKPMAFGGAVLLCVAVLSALAHRVAWTVSTRVLYLLQRLRVAERKGTLLSLGLLCIAAGVGSSARWRQVFDAFRTWLQ